MGSHVALFLEMQQELISHMKFMWYPMMIVALLVLEIIFLHNKMIFLFNALDALKKFGFPINLYLNMRRLFLCGCNGKSYVNGGQWLKPQEHLKRVVANRGVEGFFVVMLNIRKDFIPCGWMFGIIHSHDMENHPIDYLYFFISLWVE
jgi:hypothetical protein